ncbi:hypothetical protein MLD38_002961 [Melastoma candidum]|uniref:Uncharacterized protein n=1 Tax=Melastoma candidum TaxID=119954 RepID=A0ACB9S199_9MYRT|nr:hypothetical protein MLD38_002961 [Melastoma candidum]
MNHMGFGPHKHRPTALSADKARPWPSPYSHGHDGLPLQRPRTTTTRRISIITPEVPQATSVLAMAEGEDGAHERVPMGFGMWAWGNQLLWGYDENIDDELWRMFGLALENGINLFETADSYGTGRLNGQSKKLLGKFIKDVRSSEALQLFFALRLKVSLLGMILPIAGNKQDRDEVVIATNFLAYPGESPGQLVNACRASLRRLQIDRIGIGQLHWSTANYAPPQERALWDGLVAMGKFKQ